MPENTLRILLIGLGNLGHRFAGLLNEKADTLRERHGLTLRVVGAADSRGTASDAGGLDLRRIVALKEAGASIGAYPQHGHPGRSALDLVRGVEADVLCEASPVHLDRGGEPGLSCIRTALQRGMHVVTPNKGPIVLAYRELRDLASAHGVALRFDGTVAGGLPALYLGTRDLRGATIDRIEAVPNLTTGYVLDLLAVGKGWEEARTLAKAAGALEADPAWDLDGWDTAAKLAILANAVLDVPATLDDVLRTGIADLAPEDVRAVVERGEILRLLATAERLEDGRYLLRVAPVALRPDHPLGRLGPKMMGIVYHTDIYGTIAATIEEPTPLPSAATMLRDILDIVDRSATGSTHCAPPGGPGSTRDTDCATLSERSMEHKEDAWHSPQGGGSSTRRAGAARASRPSTASRSPIPTAGSRRSTRRKRGLGSPRRTASPQSS